MVWPVGDDEVLKVEVWDLPEDSRDSGPSKNSGQGELSTHTGLRTRSETGLVDSRVWPVGEDLGFEEPRRGVGDTSVQVVKCETMYITYT